MEFGKRAFGWRILMLNIKLRWYCAFVDYYASRWQLGRDIKKDLLINLIKHIEAKIAEA